MAATSLPLVIPSLFFGAMLALYTIPNSPNKKIGREGGREGGRKYVEELNTKMYPFQSCQVELAGQNLVSVLHIGNAHPTIAFLANKYSKFPFLDSPQ